MIMGGGNMKRTMRICSIALIIYFLWTEVWIGLFMGRIYTIRQWGIIMQFIKYSCIRILSILIYE